MSVPSYPRKPPRVGLNAVRRSRLIVTTVAVLVALAGCSEANPGAKDPAPESSTTSAPPRIQYVAFGDSWPYGAHCGGCATFPELYADGLEGELGEAVEFVDRTTNGGTSGDLLEDIRTVESVRAVIAESEVIVISTGANDLEPAFGSWHRDECGGADDLDCFRAIAETWQSNFDAMLAEIAALREGAPTAVRVLTNSNEFLGGDPALQFFGPEFGLAGGATITALHHDALCTAAETHDAVCIDLRPVLNGPDLTTPASINTQQSMQLVADALLASGLDELE